MNDTTNQHGRNSAASATFWKTFFILIFGSIALSIPVALIAQWVDSPIVMIPYGLLLPTVLTARTNPDAKRGLLAAAGVILVFVVVVIILHYQGWF